jgi:hypothetical protein
VLGTLWKKPLPSKLFHLEGVSHGPTSLMHSRTPCHNQHRESKPRLPKNWFSSHRMFSRSRFQNRAPRISLLNFSWANKDSSPKLTWTFCLGNAHTGFLSQTNSTTLDKGKHAFSSTQHRLPLCNIHTRGLLQTGSYGSCSGKSGRMEWETPTQLFLSVLFLCIRVDICHPGNCMRSICLPPCTCLSFVLGT